MTIQQQNNIEKWVRNSLWAVVLFFVAQGYIDQKEIKQKVNKILIEQALIKQEFHYVKKDIQRK